MKEWVFGSAMGDGMGTGIGIHSSIPCCPPVKLKRLISRASFQPFCPESANCHVVGVQREKGAIMLTLTRAASLVYLPGTREPQINLSLPSVIM